MILWGDAALSAESDNDDKLTDAANAKTITVSYGGLSDATGALAVQDVAPTAEPIPSASATQSQPPI